MTEIKTFNPGEITQAVNDNNGLLFIHFGSPLASYCETIHRQLEILLPVFAGQRPLCGGRIALARL